MSLKMKTKSDLLRVQSVFESIQGESTTSGYVTTFIRLFGCNITCSFCDQPQRCGDFYEAYAGKLINDVKTLGNHYVCITGGEPLIQPSIYEVADELGRWGFKVSIETNGCVPLRESHINFKYVMDVKCPSSGMSDKNLFNNFQVLDEDDEVKFVIANWKDFEFAEKVLRKYYKGSAKPVITFSPVSDTNNNIVEGAKGLADWLISNEYLNRFVRLQVQLHKILNVM